MLTKLQTKNFQSQWTVKYRSRLRCMLEGYVRDNYYVRFQTRSYLCCRENQTLKSIMTDGRTDAVFLFRQFWGRNSAPFPMGKHHHFSQLTQKNSQSKIPKKSELKSSFLIATKTNDFYIFTFVEDNTVSNCSLTSSDIKSNVF